jgi:hypothetical protein
MLASLKPTFLNRVLGASAQQSRQFSVAFNVKSKFEDAFEKKMHA